MAAGILGMERGMGRSSSKAESGNSGRDVVVSVRMSAEERAHLIEDAGLLGYSPSELLRRLAGQAAGLGPILTASDRHVLSDVISSLRQLALRLERLERAIRQEEFDMPDDVMAVLTEAAEAVQALAALYVALGREGRERLMGAVA